MSAEQPQWRRTWSTVQAVLLTLTVGFCVGMLVTGTTGPGGAYVIGTVFFGIALAGHLTFLAIARASSHATRKGRSSEDR